MPTCEICGVEVVDVYECSECKTNFCEECGDVRHRLCYDCISWEEEVPGESWEKADSWGAFNDDDPH